MDVMTLTPDEGGGFPLPCELKRPGDRENFTIHVGDDIDAARRDGALNEAWLRLTLRNCEPRKAVLAVSCNGRALPPGHCVDAPNCTTVTYADIPARQDDNEVTVTLERLDRSDPIRLEGIELVITYGAATTPALPPSHSAPRS